MTEFAGRLLVCGEMLLARDPQPNRLRTGGNQDVLRRKRFAGDLDRIAAREASMAVQRVYSLFGIATFIFLRNRVREASLESHQLRPIEVHVALWAFSSHASDMIDGIRGTDEHLFGITAPQRAGAAE